MYTAISHPERLRALNAVILLSRLHDRCPILSAWKVVDVDV